MNVIILDEKSRDEICDINLNHPNAQLSPVPLIDGRWIVNADIMTDVDNWKHCHDILSKCETVDVDETKFHKIELSSDMSTSIMIKTKYAAETERFMSVKLLESLDI